MQKNKSISLFAFVLTICFSISYKTKAQNPTAIREAEMERTFKEIVEAERSRHQLLNSYTASLAGANFDVKYHRFEWKIDPSVRRIVGNVATYFKASEAISTEITFDLNNNMTVDSVIHRGRKAAYMLGADKVLRITPNASIANGQVDSVRIFYAGAPDPTGLGSFVQRLRIANDPNSAEIWTLSEPYGGRDWFPGKMDLTDKVDSIDILVQTPPQYKVASNGILVSETTVAGAQKLTHWKHRYPIANYLIAIAVTNYAVYNDKVKLSRGDSMSVVNYVYPERLAASQAESHRIAAPMRLYDSLFTEYPFKKEKYGHAMFGWGGGMEHQTMSFMVNVTNIELMAHELAHQWFGDRITCGSWQDLWLNEGFATYLTGLYFENIEPQYWRAWRSNNLASSTNSTSGSVYIPAADTLNENRLFSGSLTYNKGARVLHALRFKIGDAAFFGGLRNYLNDPLLANGFARNSDLKRHLEASSGQNLTEFFNDFVFGQGYPSYDAGFCNFGNNLVLAVRQRQSHPSVSFFEMPVPIKFVNKRTGLDTTITVQVNQNQNISIPFGTIRGQVIDSLAIDPELWLLSKNNIYFQLICSPTQDIDNQWLTNISPNPATDILTLSFQNDRAEKLSVDILNALGQTVFSEKREAFAGDNSMQLSLRNLPSGTYLLKIGNSQKVANRQFVKL